MLQNFFLISKKIILKEPQGNKRPNKYREGHKQRESKRKTKTLTEQTKTNYK